MLFRRSNTYAVPPRSLDQLVKEAKYNIIIYSPEFFTLYSVSNILYFDVHFASHPSLRKFINKPYRYLARNSHEFARIAWKFSRPSFPSKNKKFIFCRDRFFIQSRFFPLYLDYLFIKYSCLWSFLFNIVFFIKQIFI